MSSDQSPPSQRPLLPEFDACFSHSSSSATSARREMKWGLWSPHDAAWMRLVRRNYEQHHRRSATTTTDSSSLIPRTLHHIWLGSPLPEACARLRESWLSRHEGWTARLWGDADVEAFGLENQEAYDAAGNFGEKSDILRYEILLRHGGVYVDVDFLCLGAFDELHRHYELYAGVSNTGTFELNNGLVGCRPDHPIMRDIVNRIREYSPGANKLPQQRGTGSHDSSPVSIGVADLLSSSLAGGDLRNQAGGVLTASEAEGAGAAGVGVKAPTMSPGVVAGGGSGGGFGGCGDPLAALVGALGAGGGGGGLLGGFLGGDDQTRLEAAVTVEPGSETATIIKTGPGVFTRAVMEWMVTATDDASRSAVELAEGEKELAGAKIELAEGGKELAEAKIELAEAIAELAEGTSPAVAAAARVMLLPPSYFYPVPNNAEGNLIGNGGEDGVRERAGRFFSEESLAAHLWGRSWQRGIS
ncbi:unnamed protein product [Laminaria digitata]